MKVEITKATKEDIPFLAQMMLKSSRADKTIGLFDYLFATKEQKSLLNFLEALLQESTKPFCHFSNFLVAKVEKKRVGTLCSYEPRVATKERFIEALQNIGCNKSVIDRLLVLDECEMQIDKKRVVFDFFEELDGYVDVGVLKALMQKSLLEARLKGYRVSQTVVEIGSLETLMFYEKLGFVKKEQKECESYKEIFGRSGVMLLELAF